MVDVPSPPSVPAVISLHPEASAWGKEVDDRLDKIKETQVEHGEQLAKISKRIGLAGPVLGSVVALATLAAPHVPAWLLGALRLLGAGP